MLTASEEAKREANDGYMFLEEPKRPFRESKVKSAEEILGPSDDEAVVEEAVLEEEAPVEVAEAVGAPTGAV